MVPKNGKGKIILVAVLIIHSVLIMISDMPSYPEYLYSMGRYFLLPATIAIIGGSYLIAELFNRVYEFKTLKRIKVLDSRIVQNAVIVSALLTFSMVFYVTQFANAQSDIANEDLTKKYAWPRDSLLWITREVPESEGLLTARARELAWATDRNSVNLIHPNIKADAFTYSDLNKVAGDFNVNYVFVDRYFLWSFPKLNSLYTSITPSQVGNVFISEQSILEYLTDPNHSDVGTGYRLLHANTQEGSAVGVWQLTDASSTRINILYATSLSKDEWRVGQMGELNSEEGSAKLMIGADQNYTFTYHDEASESLELRFGGQPHFFAWDLNTISGAEIRRVELWKDGNHLMDLNPPTRSGIWVTYFDGAASVDDVRIVIAGEANDYVSINWMVFGALEKN
jgi:hypothetical protein